MSEATRSHPADLIGFLSRSGLADPAAPMTVSQLTGGVSSEIWLVRQGEQAIAVKRALDKLRVKDDWRVPVERGESEARWLSVVGEALPGYCPEVLAFDAGCGFLAMRFLDPLTHPVWKAQLLAGDVEVSTAATVGRRLADIHNMAAQKPSLAAHFETEPLFRAIRIDPYLSTAAKRHPELASAINDIADETLRTKLTLVHGDVSPKNILVGSDGPIFLDAECAWWGDPAFDFAFCLNHLLLKCLARPDKVNLLMTSFSALCDAYLGRVGWESPATLHARTARLLPALFLARADGMSPVEYATEDGKRRIRAHAAPNILQPPATLADFASSWKAKLT